MAILKGLSSAILIKPARRISELIIDQDKSFIGPTVTHVPAWVLPSYFFRKKFTVNGTAGIHEVLRVTAQSNNAGDNAKAIGYDYLLEEM